MSYRDPLREEQELWLVRDDDHEREVDLYDDSDPYYSSDESDYERDLEEKTLGSKSIDSVYSVSFWYNELDKKGLILNDMEYLERFPELSIMNHPPEDTTDDQQELSKLDERNRREDNYQTSNSMRNSADELEKIENKTDEIDNMAIFDRVDEIFDNNIVTDDTQEIELSNLNVRNRREDSYQTSNSMRNISDELETIDDITDEIGEMDGILDPTDEVFDKPFITDESRIKEDYINKSAGDLGSSTGTANYIKNDSEKKLDDELSELDSQELFDANVSELKQKIFDELIGEYESEKLDDDLKSELKENFVDHENSTSTTNYIKTELEVEHEDIDELIEIQNIDVEYPILEFRSEIVEEIDQIAGGHRRRTQGVDPDRLVSTDNYIRNEKELQDELSELELQEKRDADVSELKLRIFDKLIGEYEREKLDDDLKSELKEITVDHENPIATTNYWRTETENRGKGIDGELIENKRDANRLAPREEYPLITPEDWYEVSEMDPGEVLDYMLSDEILEVMEELEYLCILNSEQQAPPREDSADPMEEEEEEDEYIIDEDEELEDEEEEEEEDTEGVKKKPRKKIVRKKEKVRASKSSGPFAGPFGSPSNGSYFGPNVKKPKQSGDINEKIQVDKETEIVTADGLIMAENLLDKTKEELKKLGPFSVYDENGKLIKYVILSATRAVETSSFTESDFGSIGPFGSPSNGSYFGTNVKNSKQSGDINEKIQVDSKTEIITADGLIMAENLLDKTKEELKKLGPFSVYDENGELIKYDILSASRAVETSSFMGSDFGSIGPFGSPSNGSYFGSNVKNSKQSGDINEKIQMDNETEIITAHGLIKAKVLLGKTEEELKNLGPFFLFDANLEKIKYDIISARTIIGPHGTTKLGIYDGFIRQHDIPPSLREDELTIAHLFDDIDTIDQISTKDHQRLFWHRMGIDIGPYHEMRAAYNPDDFSEIFKSFIAQSGYTHNNLIIEDKSYPINSIDDLHAIKHLDPKQYQQLVQFAQLQSLAHIDPSMNRSEMENEIGKILTMNSGFVYGPYGSCGWLHDNPDYLDHFTSSLLDRLINKISDQIVEDLVSTIETSTVVSIDIDEFKIAPITASALTDVLDNVIDDPNFIFSLRNCNIIFGISKIENIRMGRAISEVISTILSNEEADVLKMSVNKGDVSDFIIDHALELDLHKLDELLIRLDVDGGFICRSNKVKSDEFDDIIDSIKYLRDDFIDDIYLEIYKNYIEQVKDKGIAIYTDEKNVLIDRGIFKLYNKKFKEINKLLHDQVRAIKVEKVGKRVLSQLDLGSLKGWFGEIDLMGRWADQWVSTQMDHVIGEKGIGIEDFAGSINRPNMSFDDLKDYFYKLFRDHSSVSPVENGYDLTMSIKTAELGNLVKTEKETVKFISEFKYRNDLRLSIIKSSNSSGLSFLNSADLATKFSSLDSRFNDLYINTDSVDIDMHIQGYYDMLDQSITSARLIRNTEIRPIIARIKQIDGTYKFINLPLDDSSWDRYFISHDYNRKITIQDRLSDLIGDTDISNIRFYPNNAASLIRNSNGNYNFDWISKDLVKYKFNRFSDRIDPSKNEKTIIISVDGTNTKTGFIKVVDDTSRINVFVNSTGRYQAWPVDDDNLDMSPVEIKFRGISAPEVDLAKLFYEGELYTKRVYDAKGNFDESSSELITLDDFGNDTNLYPRTMDKLEYDLDGNPILDEYGRLKGYLYGYDSTRHNIFNSIKVDDKTGDFYLLANIGIEKIKLYLSTKEEGMGVAKGRFEGILNGNYEEENHVFKDVSYIGLPNSDLTHYFKYAYHPNGKMRENLFIYKEGIRIGGGSFNNRSILFNTLMNSFVGLSKLEQNKMDPIMKKNLNKLCDNSVINKMDLENLIDDLNSLYEEYPGSGDIRERAITSLKRELNEHISRIAKQISVRNIKGHDFTNSFIVDNLIAQDYVVGTDIKINDLHDKYFLYSYGGGNIPKSPFGFLFDYKNNQLYIKNINGVKANDGTWLVKPGKIERYENLVASKTSYIDRIHIEKVLQKLDMPQNKISKLIGPKGDLKTAFGDFLHILRLNELIDEFNTYNDDDLLKKAAEIFRYRRVVSGDPVEFENSMAVKNKDNLPKIFDKHGDIIENKNKATLRSQVDMMTDTLFLEHQQYMKKYGAIIKKYEHLDFSYLANEIGNFIDFSGQERSISRLEHLVEYSRISMLKDLLADSKYSNASRLTIFGYFLIFYKATDHWTKNDNIYKPINSFFSNSMLRALYIPQTGDKNTIHHMLNGRNKRPLFGLNSYFSSILASNYEDLASTNDVMKPFKDDFSELIKDFDQIANNFELIVRKNGRSLLKKIIRIGDHEVDIKKTMDLIKPHIDRQVFPTWKENSILFFYRQLLQLESSFNPVPGKYVDRTMSEYISKILAEYI